MLCRLAFLSLAIATRLIYPVYISPVFVPFVSLDADILVMACADSLRRLPSQSRSGKTKRAINTDFYIICKDCTPTHNSYIFFFDRIIRQDKRSLFYFYYMFSSCLLDRIISRLRVSFPLPLRCLIFFSRFTIPKYYITSERVRDFFSKIILHSFSIKRIIKSLLFTSYHFGKRSAFNFFIYHYIFYMFLCAHAVMISHNFFCVNSNYQKHFPCNRNRISITKHYADALISIPFINKYKHVFIIQTARWNPVFTSVSRFYFF